MASSSRVLSGSLTKGSTAVSIGSESASVDLDLYKQGYDIHTFNDLTSGIGMKIRSHSDIVRSLSGRELNHNYFNDANAPTLIKGSSAVLTPTETSGKFEYHVKHVREMRDLGQSDLYADNNPYTDLDDPDDPVHVIKVVERDKKLPRVLVDNASLSNFDGKIDVMGLFKSLDGSTTEFPFNSKGIFANFAQDQDFLRRSSELEDRKTSASSEFIATSFYLDAPENFGNVIVPSVVNFNEVTINPFDDVSNDVEDYVNGTLKFNESGNADLRQTLLSASFTVDDSRGTFDRMTVGGFDYEGGDTDSVLFGGLIR